MLRQQRDYAAIAERIHPTGDRETRMRAVVDALWAALADKGVSWVGFYLHEGGDELTLGPRRDKPACSPIGMHGACGQCFRSQKPLIVPDVRALGKDYIACDPRDLAEVVLPLLAADGSCWGVLDVDSFEVGAFDENDVTGLMIVLRKSGLA